MDGSLHFDAWGQVERLILCRGAGDGGDEHVQLRPAQQRGHHHRQRWQRRAEAIVSASTAHAQIAGSEAATDGGNATEAYMMQRLLRSFQRH
jgi:hypothetical protein